MRQPDTSPPARSRRPATVLRPPGTRPATPPWYPPLALVALAADATGSFFPVLLVLTLHGRPNPAATALAAAVCWTGVRAFHHRYARRTLAERRGLLATAHDWLFFVGVLAVLRAATGDDTPLGTALLALAPAAVITGAASAAIHHHLTRQRHHARAVRRVLVVGEPGAADAVSARLAARTDHAYVVVGAVPVGEGQLTSGVVEPGRLPGPPQPSDGAPAAPDLVPDGPDGPTVLAAARRTRADLVLAVPGPLLTGERLRRLSWAVQDAGLALVVAAGLTDVAPRRIRVESAAGLSLLHVAPPLRGGPQSLVKAALDRTAAALGLLLLAPLLALIALAIRLDSPGPALYRQTRIGHRGAPFTLWKFRTMVADAERLRPGLEASNEHVTGPLFKIRRDPRVTRVGRLLRRTSLDELPQLVNVLRGEMSLVGPRPPLPGEVASYGVAELRRLSVKPGLTGLWQVSGRSELSWDEGLALDLSYADNWSVTGDLDVLARTVRAVLDGRGAY
ncbi:sugar transferase [Streptomyces sp. 7-21]|uniref:sugar transferase n=1 Tax=Streptomyces sp. 7-21 TaxID=2802283 RepID=UPI00191D11FA|nr:sugar transferase [Streptomyces sp. 7-21]MBL1066644.1 sugar transferase [Streptomyces sp. 7-21]